MLTVAEPCNKSRQFQYEILHLILRAPSGCHIVWISWDSDPDTSQWPGLATKIQEKYFKKSLHKLHLLWSALPYATADFVSCRRVKRNTGEASEIHWNVILVTKRLNISNLCFEVTFQKLPYSQQIEKMHLLSELINTRWVIGSRPLSLLNLYLQRDFQDEVC